MVVSISYLRTQVWGGSSWAQLYCGMGVAEMPSASVECSAAPVTSVRVLLGLPVQV